MNWYGTVINNNKNKITMYDTNINFIAIDEFDLKNNNYSKNYIDNYIKNISQFKQYRESNYLKTQNTLLEKSFHGSIEKIIKPITINKPTFIRNLDVEFLLDIILSYDDNKLYYIDYGNNNNPTILANTFTQTLSGPTSVECKRVKINNKDIIYGFISNYKNNTVTIFYPEFNKLITTFNVCNNPSYLCINDIKVQNTTIYKTVLFVTSYTENTFYCYDINNINNINTILKNSKYTPQLLYKYDKFDLINPIYINYTYIKADYSPYYIINKNKVTFINLIMTQNSKIERKEPEKIFNQIIVHEDEIINSIDIESYNISIATNKNIYLNTIYWGDNIEDKNKNIIYDSNYKRDLIKVDLTKYTSENLGAITSIKTLHQPYAKYRAILFTNYLGNLYIVPLPEIPSNSYSNKFPIIIAGTNVPSII